MAAEHWYYRLDGRPHGPFTAVQFEKLIRGKTVTPGTDVSKDGKTWQSLHDLLADVPADNPPSSSPSEWINAPTPIPGDSTLPPGLKPDKKKPN